MGLFFLSLLSLFIFFSSYVAVSEVSFFDVIVQWTFEPMCACEHPAHPAARYSAA